MILLIIGLALLLVSLGAWWWTVRWRRAAGPSSPAALRLEALHAAVCLDAATYAAERHMDEFIQLRTADQQDWR